MIYHILYFVHFSNQAIHSEEIYMMLNVFQNLKPINVMIQVSRRNFVESSLVLINSIINN